MAEGRFIAYYRVSTAKQGRSGLRLEGQQKAVTDYLNGSAWALFGDFTEVETSERSDRPELEKALAACQVHRATLLIAKLDRLAREVHFVSGLMTSGVPCIAIDMPNATPFMLLVHAAMAEEEAWAISLRTRAALAAAKARGKDLGGARPGCVERARRMAPAGTAAAQAAAAAFSRRLKPHLMDCFAAGILTQRAIAAELNRRSIPARQGGPWSHVAVAAQLRRLEPGT